MDGVYRCLWCNELFVVRGVPLSIAGIILPQYHDPCPKGNEVHHLDLGSETNSVRGVGLLLATVKEN